MNEIMEFLSANYLYVMGIGLVLVFILIGFLVSKKEDAQKRKKDQAGMADLNEVSGGEINQVASNLEQQNKETAIGEEVNFNDQLVNGQNQQPISETPVKPAEPSVDELIADIKPMTQVNVATSMGLGTAPNIKPQEAEGLTKEPFAPVGEVIPNDNIGVTEPTSPNSNLEAEMMPNLNEIKPMEPVTIGDLPTNDALVVEEEPIVPVANPLEEPVAPIEETKLESAPFVPPAFENNIETVETSNEEGIVDYVAYVPDVSGTINKENELEQESFSAINPPQEQQDDEIL